MVSRGADRHVLWPHYFDAARTRAQGRRVPAALAVREPDAQWVEHASDKLGYDPKLEGDARHPFTPYEKSGRVLVVKTGPKEAAIKAVAARMKESQAARDEERSQRRNRRFS